MAALKILILSLLYATSAFADLRQLVHQGRVLRPDGTPLDGSFQMEAKIYSPGSTNCLMWGEGKTVAFQRGVFSLELGDVSARLPGAARGSSISFPSVFINTPNYALTGATCDTGTTYTPAPTDERRMAVVLYDGPLVITVYDGKILSVPYAIEAYTSNMLAGYDINHVFKFNELGSNKPTLTFSTLGASLLWDLAESTNPVLGGKRLKGLLEPIDPTDAATLKTIDDKLIAFAGGTLAMGVTRIDASSASPSVLSVTGGPITSSGTFSFAFPSQAANLFLAAPTGGAGTPSFRGIAAIDIPDLDAAKITTGSLGIARGGTGVGAFTPYAILAANMTGDALEQRTCAMGEVLEWQTGTGFTCVARLAGTLGVSRGGTGVDSSSAAAGQLLIGNGSGFTLNTLTAGSGIAINNLAGTISISAIAGTTGLSQWSNVANGISYPSGSVGIGTVTPTERLHVFGDNTAAVIATTTYGAFTPTIRGQRARGTAGTVAMATNGDSMLTLQGQGNDGATFKTGAEIRLEVDGVPAGTGSNIPGRMIFRTAPAGTTAVAERMRITSDGYVGIATAAPTTGLDINTRGTFGSAIRIPRDTTANRPIGDTGMIRYNTDLNHFEAYEQGGWVSLATGTSSWLSNSFGLNFSTGSVGIGTTSPRSPLQVAFNDPGVATGISILNTTAAATSVGSRLAFTGPDGASRMGSIYSVWEDAGTNSYLGFETRGSGTVTEQLRIRSDGRVGIGITSPSVGLDVSTTGTLGSAIRIPRDSTANRPSGSPGMMRFNDTNAKFEVHDGTGWSNMVIGTTGLSQWSNVSNGISFVGGSVGIGIASPSMALHVVGLSQSTGFRASLNGPSNPSYAFSGDSDTGIYSPGADTVSIATAGAERLRITSSGSIGIGVASPAYNLDVLGDINASNTVKANNMTLTSDIRYKRNVASLPGALEKVLRLRGVSYEWRTEEYPEKHFSNKAQIGLIAQEVESEYPELVRTEADGYKSVNYAAMVAPLLEATRELHGMCETQEKRITALEKENADLKAEALKMRDDLDRIKVKLGLD